MAEYINRGRLLCKTHELFIQPNIELWQVVNLVKNTPSADVEEVRHGEWIDYETDEPYGCYDEKAWYKCSVCGKDAYGRCWDDEWYSSPILSDYCPNCGAKMDGKGAAE